MMKAFKKPTGFTLVELLVVIVIIGVLAVVGFTAGRGALMASRATTTASNLQQIGTVIHMLREEGVQNDKNAPGTFPPYAGQINEPGNWRKFNIYELIGEVQGVCVLKSGKYVWSSLPSETILQNPLSRHKMAAKASSPGKVVHDMLSSLGSYCYNAQIEGWVSTNTPDPKVTRMVGTNNQDRQLTNPELTVMMAESNDDGQGQLWTGWGGATSPRGNYKNGAYCVFVDGHVERIDNDFLASSAGVSKHMQVNAKR